MCFMRLGFFVTPTEVYPVLLGAHWFPAVFTWACMVAAAVIYEVPIMCFCVAKVLLKEPSNDIIYLLRNQSDGWTCSSKSKIFF